MNERIEIPLSKAKIVLLLILSVAFVLAGIFFTIQPDTFISPVVRNQEIIRIAGIVAMAFFGLCSVFITRKLFDNRPGMIIDDYGITDNSNAISVGLVEWNDITGIDKVQIASTKILMLQTDKPEKYIERAKNAISKRAMKSNHKMYGSPISITSNSLKLNFSELERLILTEFEKRK